MRWVEDRVIPREMLYTPCMQMHVNDPGLRYGILCFHFGHVSIPVPGRGFFLRSYLKADLNYYLTLNHPLH